LIKLYDLQLAHNKFENLPAEIGNLINLRYLNLSNNNLSILPNEIGNLINLNRFELDKNKLQSLPAEILKIKQSLCINESSYDINNLNIENEILIFSKLTKKLNNLPINTKEIWLKSNIQIKSNIQNFDIKLPFGCVIKFL